MLCGEKIKFSVVDFDTHDTSQVTALIALARKAGWHVYAEKSKSKGWHAWFLFQDWIEAAPVRKKLHHWLEEIGAPRTEVFPKQDSLTDDQYGNFINLPLFGRDVQDGKTVFVDDDFQPITDLLGYLGDIQKIPTSLVLGEAPVQIYRSFGLKPCVIKMLRSGVTEFQRVASFRIAVQLRQAGMPYQCSIDLLKQWAMKNRPTGSKGTITEIEIHSQVTCAYKKKYSFGCEEPIMVAHCEACCPVYGKTNNSKTA